MTTGFDNHAMLNENLHGYVSHYNIFCQEKEEFSENFNLNKSAYKKAMLVKDGGEVKIAFLVISEC